MDVQRPQNTFFRAVLGGLILFLVLSAGGFAEGSFAAGEDPAWRSGTRIQVEKLSKMKEKEPAESEKTEEMEEAKEAPRRPRPTLPVLNRPAIDHSVKSTIYVVPIEGEIGWSTTHVVERAIREAEAAGAQMLMLDMNTPGGRVDAAVAVKEALLEARHKMETATYVNPEGMSAGALLAISTQLIYMKDTGHMGDAIPLVMGGGEGGGPLWDPPEKILRYVVSHFETTAQVIGYATDVAAAMVDKDLSVPGLNKEGEILILGAVEAEQWGFSRGTAANLDGAIQLAGYVEYTTVTIEKDWAENVAGFLAMISGLLITVGIIALFVEVRTPGVGLPLVVAIICFALVFWANSIAGLAGYEAVIILIIGFILLGIEVFVTPGFGLLGISGIALIAVSLVMALLKVAPESPVFTLSDLGGPIATVILAFGAGVVGILVLAWTLPKTQPFQALVLAGTEAGSEGYVAVAEPGPNLVGDKGTAYTNLRPAGTGQFGNQRFDVVSDGSYIPKGSKIEVVRIEGRRIVVKRA